MSYATLTNAATKSFEFKGGVIEVIAPSQAAADEFIRLFRANSPYVSMGEITSGKDDKHCWVGAWAIIQVSGQLVEILFIYTFTWGQIK